MAWPRHEKGTWGHPMSLPALLDTLSPKQHFSVVYWGWDSDHIFQISVCNLLQTFLSQGSIGGIRMSPAYRSSRSSFSPPRLAVVCSDIKKILLPPWIPLHLENPPHANDEVKPWPPACLLVELLGAHIHGPAQVSQSLQLLEMSKFILYEMWVALYQLISLQMFWISHLSGMYLKFCPMTKSQSYKNISTLNNAWSFWNFLLSIAYLSSSFSSDFFFQTKENIISVIIQSFSVPSLRMAKIWWRAK